MRVAVFGLGYVGTVTAAVLADQGHHVIGVDVDEPKARAVASGQSPVSEPGLDALVRSGAEGEHLHATTDAAEAVREAEVSLVCVGTPSSATGGTELRYVERATGDVVDALAEGAGAAHTILVRSTVPPGTIETVLTPIVAGRLGERHRAVGIGSCPEFLREGSAIADFYDAPLTVVGTNDPQVAAAARELFSFLEAPVRIVAPREAEGLKYACNAFHAVKISFANEIGRLYRGLGVDARQVMELFCEDRKLNISPSYLAPGFAFGGSCLPKDLRSLLHLARTHFIDLPLLAGALATNGHAVSDVVNRVLATDARKVAILGLSFKMHSDDLRESPYVDVAETLIGKGFDVRVYDPLVDTARLVGENRRYFLSKLPHVQRVLAASAGAALAGADVALVASSEPAILDAVLASPPPRVIDLSGRLGHAVEHLPQYEGVAW